MAAVICATPLLILGLLLIVWALLRKKPTPSPPPKPAPPPPTAGPYLETVGLPGGPRRFRLKAEGVTIGREPENDLVITEEFPAWESVSRRHARIRQQANHWVVEDLDSTNGIYINERRTGRNLLRDGWRLGIGGVKFVFRVTAEANKQHPADKQHPTDELHPSDEQHPEAQR
jgi:pSer/pThr/pTyr-binding forkhead associated (FHA) protein